MTLTNEKENVIKSSVVMTPGYNSSVRIIGVASNTVIPTATQEAPLSKTSAFVIPETIVQTAEKVLGPDAMRTTTQAQYNPGIFPEPASQLTQTSMASDAQIPAESVPVQVTNPQGLNTLMGNNLPFAQTMDSVVPEGPASQQITPQSYTEPTVPMPAVSYENTPQQQFAPSAEIQTHTLETPQIDISKANDSYQNMPSFTPLNEPPILSKNENIEQNNNIGDEPEELIELLKDYIKADIEKNNKILEKIEQYLEQKKGKNKTSIDKMTTSYVSEPNFNTQYTNDVQYNESEGYSVPVMHM